METRKALPRVGAKAGGRLGNLKERTGCLTCKKRKIKCDEDKPACYRCSSTGRQCEGYINPGTRIIGKYSSSSAHSVLAGGQLILHPWKDVDEHRAFDSFCQSGVFAVGCQVDFDLWSRGIPQLAHSHSAIKHAVIAIGSLLRIQKRQDTCSPTRTRLNQSGDLAESFAIRHYHKAIQLTLSSIERCSGDVRLAGITCVLFFCIEALQGHEKEALALFERGHKAQLRSKASRHSGDDITSGLVDSFSRLAVQWSMFEGSVVDAADYPTQLNGPIHTTMQAQQDITSLILLVFNIVSDGFSLKWAAHFDLHVNHDDLSGSEALCVLKAREEAARNSLQLWYARFLEYRHRTSSDNMAISEIACREMLLLRYYCLQFWLLGSTEQSELVYDDYLVQFKEAVALARTCIELMERSGMIVPFSFELGVIPPLHIIIHKCRDPVVRRDALHLLRRAPAQEGLWNRDIISQVCERVIELEEGSDAFIDTLPSDLVDMTVPDTMRLKMVKINLRTTHEDGRRGDLVEFYARPYGLNGQWSVTQEFFMVSS